MKVSQTTRYALQALIHLTRQGGSQPVASHVIAEAEGSPEPFLRKVLERLASTRLLVSLKGATGGYRLARPAGRITLLEVVETVEGPIRGRLWTSRGPTPSGWGASCKSSVTARRMRSGSSTGG